MIVGSDGQRLLIGEGRPAQSEHPKHPGWTPEASEPASKMDAPQKHEPTPSQDAPRPHAKARRPEHRKVASCGLHAPYRIARRASRSGKKRLEPSNNQERYG